MNYTYLSYTEEKISKHTEYDIINTYVYIYHMKEKQ